MKNDQKDRKHNSSRAREEVRETGNRSNLSPSQGNITEKGERGVASGNTTGGRSGSGLNTKKTVTGSDYDGQAA